MESTEHPTHPLVEKAVRGWLELAARYDVKVTVRRGESEYQPTAVSVNFDTGLRSEAACVMIYPPSRPGRTVRQSPIIIGYFLKRGKAAYGSQPGITLRRLRDRIIWSWSPTAGERLQASIASAEASLRAAGAVAA